MWIWRCLKMSQKFRALLYTCAVSELLFFASSSGWPYQQVPGYCITICGCISNIDIIYIYIYVFIDQVAVSTMWEPFACQTCTPWIPSHFKSCRDTWWHKDGTFRGSISMHQPARCVQKRFWKMQNVKGSDGFSVHFVFWNYGCQTCGCCLWTKTRRTVAAFCEEMFWVFVRGMAAINDTVTRLAFWYFSICVLLDDTPFLEATVAGFRGKVDGNS